MKLAQNIKAISRLSLILLLLISFVTGAFLSYLGAIGPIIELGIRIPDDPSVAITSVSFTSQNTSYFNLTLLNPSYSPSKTNIITILTLTEERKIHTVTAVDPSLPYELLDGYNQTFQCFWDWANYTGQIIGISAFVEDGCGPTSVGVAPFVGLPITDVDFNSSVSMTSFNLTVQGHENSTTYINITDITVQTKTLKAEKVIPPLPYTLNPNSSITFKCLWDWTDYRNASISIVVNTLQGYFSNTTYLTPNPVLEVKDTFFNETDINHFNLTLRNSELSPSYLNISEITLTLENKTIVEINGTEIKPSLPYTLYPDSSTTFEIPWNWTTYRNKIVTLSVHTLQNYTIYNTTVTPSPIGIINAVFDPVNTNSFNITVQNSEFYTTYVNLTDITLVLENGTIQSINGTEMEPTLPYPLYPNSSITFECPWNWTNYQGKNVTIIIHSAEGYTAQFTKVTPTRVFFAIVSVIFDPIDAKSFNITVRNSEFSLDDVLITKIAVTLENGTIIEISDVLPVLPYTLNSNSTAIFRGSWDWTNYRNKNIVITVHTRKGYMASTQYTTPPAFQQGQ